MKEFGDNGGLWPPRSGNCKAHFTTDRFRSKLGADDFFVLSNPIVWLRRGHPGTRPSSDDDVLGNSVLFILVDLMEEESRVVSGEVTESASVRSWPRRNISAL